MRSHGFHQESGRVGTGQVGTSTTPFAVRFSNRYKAVSFGSMEKLVFGILERFHAARFGRGGGKGGKAELIVWHGTFQLVWVFSVCRVSPFVSCEKRR